jgi:hypothetical protein
LTAAGLGAVIACSAGAPPAAPSRLEPTGDTILTPYGEITDAAWLGNERWVVIAPQDRAVSVADFRAKRLTTFARARARELEQPFHLFRAGDSIYIADWMRSRLTQWSLEGRPGAQWPASDQFRGALPRAGDTLGRWYYEVRAAPGRDGRGNLDSALILRTGAGAAGFDTIARLAPLDLAEIVSDGRRRLERRLLSGQDRWGVLPDGAVWVARVTQNRVDWRDPAGRSLRGEVLPDRVLPITGNDRDIFLSRFEPGLQPTVSQIPFAAIKPPFEAAMSDPEGDVWLVKSRAIGDTLRDYQVIDRSGRLARRMNHAGLGRILAVGTGYALVGEPFEDGVRLLLFRLPSTDGARGI